MKGLILSKSSAQYLELCQQDTGDFGAYFCFNHVQDVIALDTTEKAQIEWILAEPNLTREVLPHLPNLKWVQSTWAGVERLLGTDVRHDYALTNVRDIFGPLMCEYLLTYLLGHVRRADEHAVAQVNKRWLNENTGVLRGKTLLMFGAGSIGQYISRTLQFLGVHVLAVVNQPRSIEHVDEVFGVDNCDVAIARADFVVNILPNTPSTQNFFDAAFFAKMQAHALFINVGRGQAVVEADLAAALVAKTIAGAVLDVYQTEPLPDDHVFWQTPNLKLTSHTAAPSLPLEVFAIFKDNFERMKQGQPLKHLVDFKRGY